MGPLAIVIIVLLLAAGYWYYKHPDQTSSMLTVMHLPPGVLKTANEAAASASKFTFPRRNSPFSSFEQFTADSQQTGANQVHKILKGASLVTSNPISAIDSRGGSKSWNLQLLRDDPKIHSTIDMPFGASTTESG